MKYSFSSFNDFTTQEADDFDAANRMCYDVRSIHHFLNANLQTTDHDSLVRFGSLLQSIVSLIKTYIHEDEDKENSIHPVEDN